MIMMMKNTYNEVEEDSNNSDNDDINYRDTDST
jgi:hypothetical protein